MGLEMTGTVILRAGTVSESSQRKGKGGGSLLDAVRHNKRAIPTECSAHGRFDPSRTLKNYSLRGGGSADDVMRLARQRMDAVGFVPEKARRDHVQALELVISIQGKAVGEERACFSRCVDWVCERFGPENIIAADVHKDGGTPHCHILMMPISSGKWVGGASFARERLRSLRAHFGATVATPMGLRFGESMSPGQRRLAAQRVSEAFKEACGPAFSDAVWVALAETVERDPQRLLDAMDIDTPTPTMADIFTGPGKGSSERRGTAPKPIGIEGRNPIGFATGGEAKPIGLRAESRSADRTLSCVGFAFPSTAFHPPTSPPKARPKATDPRSCWPIDADPHHVGAQHHPDQYADPDGQSLDVIQWDDGTTRIREPLHDQLDTCDEVEAWQS